MHVFDKVTHVLDKAMQVLDKVMQGLDSGAGWQKLQDIKLISSGRTSVSVYIY